MIPNSDAVNAINILQPILDQKRAECDSLTLAIQSLQGTADTQYEGLTTALSEATAPLNDQIASLTTQLDAANAMIATLQSVEAPPATDPTQATDSPV